MVPLALKVIAVPKLSRSVQSTKSADYFVRQVKPESFGGNGMITKKPLSLATRCLLLLGFGVLPLVLAHAQTAAATLSGSVTDQNGAVVPGVNVTVLNTDTSLERQGTTNDEGYFAIPLLPPGRYVITARRDGFMVVQLAQVILNVGDQKSVQIKLTVGDVNETVNVSGEAPLISESPAVNTIIDRRLVGNLPLNGRSFNTLFELTPGVVLFNGNAQTGGVERDNFSINGQRADANYTTVDGVSANVGANLFAAPGQNESGSVMARNVQGGTSNLVSIDALQEFKIQTSSYAPEFGRTPGGQISIVTRSGTEKFSGTLFEYFRNDVLDANDWFNNANHLPKSPLRQNDFGGVLGGPLYFPHFGEGGRLFQRGRGKTFFFFSYEGLRLVQPTTSILDVPSLSVRQLAPASIKPFLSAFPLPNGPATSGGFATLAASYSVPSVLNATSIRIDHSASGKLSLFGRYNHAPSNTLTRNQGSLNFVFNTKQETDTITLGATLVSSAQMSNEFRVNYSDTRGASDFTQDSFGGGSPLPESALPFQYVPGKSTFVLILGGNQARFNFGQNNDNFQRQFNVIDNVSLLHGAHSLKFGVDYRRLLPIIGSPDYLMGVFFNAAAGPNDSPTPGTALSGITSFVQVGNLTAESFPAFTNFSLYGQDTWHPKQRLSLTYGIRWELNPPPTQGHGEPPFVVTGLENLRTVTLAPRGTQLYATTYGNFAPRFGISYQLSQRSGRETMLRAGVGIFYDLGYGSIAQAFTGIPYSKNVVLFAVPFPLSPDQSAPPSRTFSPPYSLIRGADPDLKLPRIYQLNLTLEQSLGANQKISAAYVAAVGRSLLRQEVIRTSILNPTFTELDITRNTGRSDYNALQLQFVRRLSRRFQALASYTWSKSLDNSSGDSLFSVASELIPPDVDRGPSDFDVRHAFSAAVSYDLPTISRSGAGRVLLDHWSLDLIARARSGLPVNVLAGFPSPRVLGAVGARPDLVPGVPLYLHDSAVAEETRINRSAFTTATIPKDATGTFLRQGTLGRNALRGFGASQLDLTFRREFGITERARLQFRAELFNIFNHPNFGKPVPTLSSGTFGVATQMLGRSLGGLSPLYQIGGPRSIQFALRLSF